MIEFDQVSKIYPSTQRPVRALDCVSLRIGRGEFVAVRGPSGCGKSTLLMLCGGLCQATSGRLLLDGRELRKMTAAERAAMRGEKVGYVFQNFHLLPYLNVMDNVLAASLSGKQVESRKRAGLLLAKFQLADRLTHRPGQLSTGERQRVAMARAVLNGPELILADEPTGNLDPENAKVVMDFLAEFHRQGGTVLLVTHEQSSAAYADRTVLLCDGALAGDEAKDAAAS